MDWKSNLVETEGLVALLRPQTDRVLGSARSTPISALMLRLHGQAA